MKGTYKVTGLTEPQTITKKDGSSCLKQIVTLQELGGKYEDQYVATLLSEYPSYLKKGSVVAAALRFSVREYEGQEYQDVLLQEYVTVYANPAGELPKVPSI